MLKKKHLFYLVDYRLKLLFVSWGVLYFTMFIILLNFFKNILYSIFLLFCIRDNKNLKNGLEKKKIKISLGKNLQFKRTMWTLNSLKRFKYSSSKTTVSLRGSSGGKPPGDNNNIDLKSSHNDNSYMGKSEKSDQLKNKLGVKEILDQQKTSSSPLSKAVISNKDYGKTKIIPNQKQSDEILIYIYNIIILLFKSSNKMKDVLLKKNKFLLNKLVQLIKNHLFEKYGYLDINENKLTLCIEFYVEHVLKNRLNHGSIIMSKDYSDGIEILSTTKKEEKSIYIETIDSEKNIEYVQQHFFDVTTGKIGVFYIKKIPYNIGFYVPHKNEIIIKINHSTINLLNDIDLFKSIISFLYKDSGVRDFIYELDNKIIKELNEIEPLILKKNIDLRTEENLRIFYIQNYYKIKGVYDEEISLDEYIDWLYNLDEIKGYIDLTKTTGFVNNYEFNELMYDVISDEEQVLIHIGYYRNIFYQYALKHDFQKELNYDRFLKNKLNNFESEENFDYLRIEIFEDINLGLYSVIKEYGIKELFENYTVEEVYELIKEKLDCIKNGNLE